MTLDRGAKLHNRYRILEILGQGGMGAIYRAIDENLGVEVAVKENLFTTDEYARQFRREATILAGLRHPNLPRVSDHFVIDEQGQYLVMDYIEGEDLRERMDHIGVIPEEEAMLVGVAICDALLYMHTQNPPILHRDLKPGNVKISPDGKIYLVDFGLAKIAFVGQRTTTGARAMTPGYSPPEQYGGARTDHRSDIYSLAATLYASTAGVVPEDSLARTMEQTDLTPLRDRNPEISRRFSKVIEKALAVHPDDRYQTADEFKQALLGASSSTKRKVIEQGVLKPLSEAQISAIQSDADINQSSKKLFSTHTSTPIPTSTPLEDDEFRPTPRPRPNRRRGCLFAWMVLSVLLIVAGGSLYFFRPEIAQNYLGALPVAVFPIPTATPQPPTPTALPTSTSTDAPSATIPPTETTAATDTSTPLPVLPSLTQTQTQTQTPASISTSTSTFTPTFTFTHTATQTTTPTITPITVRSPTATPQGGGYGQVAFASDRSGSPQIWVINMDGTGLRQLTDIQWGACQPNWSPDGTRLIFISPCEENRESYKIASLFIINADGSGLEPLPTTGGGDYDPAWSPDGQSIVFTSMRENFRPQLYLMDLDTKEVLKLSDDERDQQAIWSSDGSTIIFITTRNGPYQIWRMNPDGTEALRFSASGSLWDTYPALFPDGHVLIFTQKEPGGIPRLMGARYPDGSTAEFRIYPVFGAIPMREASISPDGFWLVFESWEGGGDHSIYIMRSTGSELSRLTFDASWDFDPDWRPIGQ